ncbi:hypothetical protein F4861DRAFT_507963 [Xylaria intraflava]|nr:hypothetical protein F4861DRAFT_507963 [Xylaria intraflava]
MEESKRIAELEKQLREVRQRADEAEGARREEKERRLEAERLADEADRARREVEAQIQHTTLEAYIRACHDLVYAHLEVEPHPGKSTTGSIPPPYAKLFPLHVKKWTNYHEEQHEILLKVYEYFPTKEPLFDNRTYLKTLGEKVRNAPLANEKMLELFLHTCVEDPVRCIIHELAKSTELQTRLKIGHGIVFENHLKILSNYSYQAAGRHPRQPPPPPPRPQDPEQVEERPRTPNPAKDPPRLNPDQICVCRYDGEGAEKRIVISISEYKPPHKLSLPQLRTGLEKIDMMEVVSNNKIPTEEGPKFEYYATQLVASAITQTFHYMVKTGLAYGLLTTGEGIVFLKIDWDDPQTVYYHFAEPAEEMATHKEYRSCTAVSQYLSFHLLALRDYSYRDQDVRDRAMSKLLPWTTDFRKAASTIPEKQRKPPKESPAYKPNVYPGEDRGVPRRRKLFRGDNQHDGAMRGRDDDDRDKGGRDPNRRNTPGTTEQQGTRRSARLAARQSDSRGSQGASGGGGQTRGVQDNDRSQYEGLPHQHLAYCTQKCLLGLVNGDVLDRECPNLKLHQHQSNDGGVISTDSRHPISYYDFLELLSRQLKCTLAYGITSLDINGSRGVLFKVTLLAYGYTLIGKGTIQEFIPYLEHEARVYARLEDVQGVHVPVFLGTINLRSLGRTYYYDFDVDIVFLCLLSWGGLGLGDGRNLNRNKSTLQPMAVEAMEAIHRRGVLHKDARYENVLFNPQTGRVMLIDFERSQLLDRPQPTLAAHKPNKRRRLKKPKKQIKSATYLSDVSADLAGVAALFYTV